MAAERRVSRGTGNHSSQLCEGTLTERNIFGFREEGGDVLDVGCWVVVAPVGRWGGVKSRREQWTTDNFITLLKMLGSLRAT